MIVPSAVPHRQIRLSEQDIPGALLNSVTILIKNRVTQPIQFLRCSEILVQNNVKKVDLNKK